MGNITIFKSIKDTSAPFYRSVDYIIHRIKEGKSKDIVKRIREEKDKEKRNQIKKELPAICFSGEFTRREDSALVSHSGVICLDFDGFSKKADMLAKKEEFTKDKYTLSVFISPSGDGLKLLVKIPADEDKHKSYFKSLEKYYNCEQFDKTSKNISRVCYESYDPLIFHNPESKEWDKVSEEEFEQIKQHTWVGSKMFQNSRSPILHAAAEIALTHHEHWDGSGYPHGLSGDQIPISGRIVMLSDHYDALRSRRSYKRGIDHEATCRIILEGDGRTSPAHFDPRLLEIFAGAHWEFDAIFEQYKDESRKGLNDRSVEVDLILSGQLSRSIGVQAISKTGVTITPRGAAVAYAGATHLKRNWWGISPRNNADLVAALPEIIGACINRAVAGKQ
jgi:hypothetical protein